MTLCCAACANQSQTRERDPLFGLPAPAPAANHGNNSVSEQEKTAYAVPPMPKINDTISTAALASGTQLPGSQELRIAGSRASAVDQEHGTSRNTTTGAAWAPQSEIKPHPMVSLQNPVLPEEPAPITVRSSPLAQNGQAGQQHAQRAVPAVRASIMQLKYQLKQRGMTWEKQENTPSGVRFICGIPNRQHPQMQRIYEATAGDLEMALRAVLQKIDAQQ